MPKPASRTRAISKAVSEERSMSVAGTGPDTDSGRPLDVDVPQAFADPGGDALTYAV